MTLLAPTFRILIGLAVITVAGPARAQIQATRSDPGDRSQVLVVRAGASDPATLKTFDGAVIEAAPSPSGRWVGVVVAHQPTSARAKRVFRLHLLDEGGETLRRVDHVQQFTFSPDERYVAVIRGSGYEGGPGFFPESTEILGLQGPDLGPIEGLAKATEIAWAEFDNDGLVLLARVYEGQSLILEFILQTRVVVPTHFYGLHFSPGGRFYYLTPGESLRLRLCQSGLPHDSCVRVFRREDYQPMSLDLKPSLRRTLGWADERHILLAEESSHDGQVFDVVAAKPKKTFAAADWRWNTRRGMIVKQTQPNANFRKLGKPELRALLQ